MSNYPKIYLKRGKEESLKRFHPWVFSGAIHHADEVEEGDLVEVVTSNGDFIGVGHYQIGSIAVRTMGVHMSSIAGSLKVLKISSYPIPLVSPCVIATRIFLSSIFMLYIY